MKGKRGNASSAAFSVRSLPARSSCGAPSVRSSCGAPSVRSASVRSEPHAPDPGHRPSRPPRLTSTAVEFLRSSS
ncbi:Hypothetical protein SCLAV_0058 [Streptomyces clavuligerus]|uniref:Uncharacterized protein n=1 Tax=Streptomyces clavuligerus TaxID=1901 RepID=E2Q5X4_STRCL|nr:Hypothetical protein SCLAV_0058 [Streptomyces clavuligerus]